MPFISYAQNYEDVILWRALRDPTVHAQALKKPLQVTGSETADLRNAPGQKGVTPAI